MDLDVINANGGANEPMSAMAWMRRRALEREVNKLRLQLDAARGALPLHPGMNPGTWFAGAGLTLASGFLAGATSAVPGQFDRSSVLRWLMQATAEALTMVATFVEQHPPDAESAVRVAGPPPDPPQPLEPDAPASIDVVTRADLLQRLRQQSAGRESC